MSNITIIVKQERYKLPRKKKKEFKTRDPELYRMTFLLYPMGDTCSVSRGLHNLVVSIESVGGSIADGMALIGVLDNTNSDIECRIDGSCMSMASMIMASGVTH